MDDNAENEKIAYRSDQSSGTDSEDSETLSLLKNSHEIWVRRDIQSKYELPREKPRIEVQDQAVCHKRKLPD